MVSPKRENEEEGIFLTNTTAVSTRDVTEKMCGIDDVMDECDVVQQLLWTTDFDTTGKNNDSLSWRPRSEEWNDDAKDGVEGGVVNNSVDCLE